MINSKAFKSVSKILIKCLNILNMKKKSRFSILKHDLTHKERSWVVKLIEKKLD